MNQQRRPARPPTGAAATDASRGQPKVALLPPRVAAPEPAASDFPLELTSFVGRSDALREIRDLLPTTRLLTLTGPPGVGKTRLAMRVAVEDEAAWRDGVWLVELAGVSDPDSVASAVAAVLSVREQAGTPLVSTLTAALQRLQIRIVLDNCEHLIEAAAHLAAHLLERCPGVHIVATGREALGVPGEVAWQVPPLDVPDVAATTCDEIAAVDSVRLFVERARAARPRFSLAEHNAAAVAQICQRLDGIPLAIELAAARMNVLTPEEVVRRLDDRFALLSGGGRTVLPRQQTLEAAIGWSYALLTEEERVLLRRLSAFAGSFSLAAAEGTGVGEGSEPVRILDVLARLVTRSLVVADERDGATRYRLIGMLREYAEARAREAGELDANVARHAAWYARWAEGGEPRFWSADQGAWLAELELELPNLRRALDWCLGTPGQEHTALQLVSAVWRLWDMSRFVSEGRAWLQRALAYPSGPCVARVRALNELCHLRALQGDHEGTASLLIEAHGMARAVGYPLGEGLVLSSLALLSFAEGDIEEAQRFAVQGVARSRALSDGPSLSYNLGSLGSILRQCGQVEHATAALEEAVALARRAGDGWFGAYLLSELGRVRFEAGDLEGAASAFRDALALGERRWSTHSLAVALAGLGAVAMSGGDDVRGVRLVAAATAVIARCGISRPPFADHDVSIEAEAARGRIGEAAFRDAWSEGESLSFEAAIAYALDGQLRPERADVARASNPAAAAHPLTPRELEVARLVAAGQSNREIASALVISPRTASSHLEHILHKLGLRRRAQIATWISTYDLPGAPPRH